MIARVIHRRPRAPRRPWRLPTAAAALVLVSCFGAAPVAAVQYDLGADWSDTQNPNGPWTYRDGKRPLPHVSAWEGLVPAMPGWAHSETSTSRIPFWFMSDGGSVIGDWQAGDVLVHTTDEANGIGNGVGNVIWRSPISGTVDVSGALWMGRDIARSNHWTLYRNGLPITSGDVASGDAFSRANPMSLAQGSGGAAALLGIPVAVGDSLELGIEKTSLYGDFVGVRLQIATADVGIDPSTAARRDLELAPVRPNPAAGSVRLRMRLPTAGWTRLEILDVAGRRVRILVDRTADSGWQEETWDGRDASGSRVTAGVYLARLTLTGASGASERTQRIVLNH